jgi:hypothetical protein
MDKSPAIVTECPQQELLSVVFIRKRGGNSMSKRIAALLVIVLIAGTMGMAFAAGTPGTWTGTVTDKMCATKGVSLHDADCAKKCVAAGDKYALYNTADKKVYVLMPQDKVAAHAGHDVIIKGTVDGDTITVTSVTMPAKKAS